MVPDLCFSVSVVFPDYTHTDLVWREENNIRRLVAGPFAKFWIVSDVNITSLVD